MSRPIDAVITEALDRIYAHIDARADAAKNVIHAAGRFHRRSQAQRYRKDAQRKEVK